MDNLQDISCANCHVTFWLTKQHYSHLRESKQTFYCPGGHANVYRKSEADRVRELLDAKSIEAAQLRATASRLERELDYEIRKNKKHGKKRTEAKK